MSIVIASADPHSDEVQSLLAAYFSEIAATFGFDPALDSPTDADDFLPPHGRILVVRAGPDATGDSAPVGCGAVRLIDPDTAEIKRMWLDPSVRGQGAGAALLAALEHAAGDLGAHHAVLDTNASLTRALALYRSAGWREVPAYNANHNATHWFAKDLG